MIIISPEHLKQIADEAEAVYPNECCGLIVGIHSPIGNEQTSMQVTRIASSQNVSQISQQDSFEVDPKIRFDLMQALENTENSDEHIIGHYHSHPDHPAIPSERDLNSVYEPELVWLITSVFLGQAIATSAFRPKPDASGFERLEIRGTDWHEIPSRKPQ